MELLTKRFVAIEKIITELASMALSNKELSTNFIHSLVVEKKEVDISELFPLWNEMFKYKKNIKVYFKSDYCFFENKKENILDNNCFKIFIPIDEKHIFKKVEAIFNFLSDNNISHSSYVTKNIRNDVITIKLNKIEDANKLNLFIKENKEGLIESNNFAFTYNDLAFAIDRKVDYNFEVAFLLNKYIEYLKDLNLLNNASLANFREFLITYYNNVFKYGIKLEDFINDKLLEEKTNKNEAMNFYKLDQLVNYRDTFSLIIKAIDENNDFMLYMKHHETLNQKNYNFNACNKVNELMEMVFGVKEKYYTLKDKERILQESIISTIKKYNMEQGHIALNQYIIDGSAKDFTRDYNARNNMHYIITPIDAVTIIKSFFSGELNIDEYVNVTMNINLSKIKRDLLDRAVIETIKEKGLAHTKETLEKLTKEQNIEDLKKISKNNDARRNLYKFIKIDEFETLLKQTLSSLPGSIVQEKYIDLYLNRIKKNIEEA